MKPVWIKYYGLIPMTRFGYLVALAVAGGLTLVVVLLACALGVMPPLDTLWSRAHYRPGSGLDVFFYNYMYWILIVCLIAQVIDTWTTLRTFARKAAEQRAALAAAPAYPGDEDADQEWEERKRRRGLD